MPPYVAAPIAQLNKPCGIIVTFDSVLRRGDQRLPLTVSEKKCRHGLRGRRLRKERDSNSGGGQEKSSGRHRVQDALCPYQLLFRIGATFLHARPLHVNSYPSLSSFPFQLANEKHVSQIL